MSIAATQPRVDTPPLPKWTILLYGAADNNLQKYMIGNVRDLETVGSDQYTNLVTQFDFGAECNRYLLQKATNPTQGQISTAPLEKIGPVNMSDPQTLADSIVWAQTKFPAEHYMVIISDHGGGWLGACEDDSHGGWMTMPMMREGFDKAFAATGKKVDIVGLDACLMAAVEVTHELKDVCDYQVVSEQTEGAAGWPYSHIVNPTLLSNLRQMHLMKLQVAPRDLAVLAVKDSAGTQDVLPTMTAVDSAKVGAVTAAIDNLAKSMVATDTIPAVLGAVVEGAQSFYPYKDAADLARCLHDSDYIKDNILKAATNGVIGAVWDAVIAEEHSDKYPGAHGLTIQAGASGEPKGYDDLKFAHDTQWPAALAKFASTIPTQIEVGHNAQATSPKPSAA